MKFKGFPKPIYDETFTSWLFRCIYSKNITSYDSLRLGELIREVRELSCPEVDPDFDFESNFFRAAQECLGVEKWVIVSYFSPKREWIIPWGVRSQYCYECFVDDISAGKLPAWRKSWCYAESLRCETHNRELDFYPVIPSAAKAWDCFNKKLHALKTSPEPSRRIERLWVAPKSIKLRSVLYRRIYRMSGLKKQSSEDFGDWGKDSYCFIVLIHILLKARSSAIGAGIASKLFGFGRVPVNHKIRSYEDSVQCGALECPSRERMAAFILAGYLLSMLPKKNIGLIEKIYSDMDLPFPANKKLIGAGATSKKEHEFLVSVIEKFNKNFSCRLGEFIGRY